MLSVHRTTWTALAWALALACCTFLASLASAAPQFPKLTGRVVDQAGLLSQGAAMALTTQLEAHETATGNQVVVVTLPDLQGYAISEYGVALARQWKIGQAESNNGVLLIVAMAERKIRIEVGYGLEGQLTDATSGNIIRTVVEPAFRSGDFEAGLANGATAIIDALGGRYVMVEEALDESNTAVQALWLVLMLAIVFWIMPSVFGRDFTTALLLGALLGGRGGSYGGRSGGFRGGGGSFGGGGASGGW